MADGQKPVELESTPSSGDLNWKWHQNFNYNQS